MTIASNPATPTLGNVTAGPVPTHSPAQTKFGILLAHRVKRPSQYTAPALCPVARQAAIENALSMALWHIRHSTDTTSLQAATGRAIRAASMLKQACTEFTNGGRAKV